MELVKQFKNCSEICRTSYQTTKIETTETHIVPLLPTPVRLQEYGVGVFNSAVTKSALKKSLKKQYILVNDSVASTATWIRGGETITITFPEETKPKRELILPLKVLFEDEHLAMIHKPAGIQVSGNSFKTIANALGQNLKPSSLPDKVRPQPIHRLDYATSGILLVGKTSLSIRELNKLFEEKTVAKVYYAVTMGEMDGQGTINLPIENKLSRSHYEVIESVPSERFGTLNLVKLKPETGRRHQLRIHLSSIGNPILGDKDYGQEGLILNGKGLYLHAHSLTFIHPFTAEEIHIQDQLPERFRKIFTTLH